MINTNAKKSEIIDQLAEYDPSPISTLIWNKLKHALKNREIEA